MEKLPVKPAVEFLNNPYGATCLEFTGVNMGIGCSMSCIYCHYHKYIEQQYPDSIGDTFDLTMIKKKKEFPKFIYLCPHTEPFSKENRDNTHDFLKIVLPKGVYLWILTKSIIPDKTLKLLSQYPEQIELAIGLTNLDDKRNKLIEPGCPSARERLSNLPKIVDIGCRYGARMDPLFPLIDDTADALENIISTFAKYKVKNLVASYLMLPASIYSIFLDIPEFKSMLKLFTERSPTTGGVALSIPLELKMNKYSQIAEIGRKHNISLFVCSCRDIRLKDFKNNNLGYSLNCR